MPARRLAWQRSALIALGAVVLAGIGVVAFEQLAGEHLGPASNAQALTCSPQPCLNLQNYTLWVSNVSESDGIVRMQIAFRNASDSTHAAPEDLQLIDSRHQSSTSVQDPPGCTHWSRTEFNNGARYGPVTICFHPASTDPPLVLRWSPDMGLFCCQADLRIK